MDLDPGRRTIQGRERVTFQAPAGGEALFYLYPNHLARPSAGLSDINYYWYYPHRFSPGRMTVTRATRADGTPLALSIEDLPAAGEATLLRLRGLGAPAGAAVTVTLEFHVELPKRFGAFGCTDGTCVLMGGFYPMLVARSADGSWDLHGLPERAGYGLSLRGPPGAQVVALGRPGTLPASADLYTRVDDAAYATLIVAPALHASTRTAAGAQILYLSQRSPPPPADPRPRLLPYIPEDYAALALDVAARTVVMLAAAGVHMDATRPLVLCEVPLRDELAEPHPGVVLVSDRIFHIFPIAAFRRFHELALVRAIAAFAVEQYASSFEAPGDLSWEPDALGAFFVDLYTLEQFGDACYVNDLLKYVSFVPQVDQLLYAPTVEFAPSYFQSVYEPDDFRDDLRRWNNALPRGKLVYEKLRDLVTDARFPELVRAHLGGRQPLRRAAETIYGRPLGWFFDQWLGPLPQVNYKLVSTESRPAPGGGFDDRIVVEKQGDVTVVEPVEVEAAFGDGRSTVLRWDGRGASHVFALHTGTALSSVTVDPRQRLVEQLPGSNDDLRFDDRSPPQLKFLYNSLAADYDAGGRKLELSIDFNLWRVHDLKNALRIAPFKTFSSEAGLLAEYQRYFGPKADAHRLAGEWATGLVLTRIDPTFLPGTRPGSTLSLNETVQWDDRDYVYEPMRDETAGITGGLTLTRFDGGALSTTWNGGAWASIVRTPIVGTTLAAEVSGAMVGGDIRSSTELLQAGGPVGLRGYAGNALLGRSELRASLELRQVFVHDLDVNLFHFEYLRGLGGVLFADAATVSGCGDDHLFGRGTYYADVGYSMRFFLDHLGMSQTMVSLDLAVPLQRTVPICGAPGTPPAFARVPPVELFLSFVPAF